MNLGHIIVPGDAPREVWEAERGEGVTASEALEVARAGLKGRRAVAERKMNGSKFHGNAYTRAGQAREAALLDEALDHLPGVEPNSALWSAAENPLHRATPDGIGTDEDGNLVVVEVKSHAFGWEHDTIPADHRAQLQWQMHVVGADYALYAFEVRDEDDQPPAAGATWIRVERDEEMIEWLVDRADAFISWRNDGCPEVDDLPDGLATALDEWAPIKRELEALSKREKAAAAALKKAAADMPHVERFGTVGMGEAGGFQISVAEIVSIDEEAWKNDAPAEHAAIQKARADIAIAEAAAKRRYPKITRRPSLRFQEVSDAR